jgi:putative membrane protein
MLLETALAYVHWLAIFTMVTFLVSEAALCRVEWMNARIVERLARVDMLYGIASVVVLLTGLARSYWGSKGLGWYWTNPLLHAKVTLFVVIALLSIKPTMTYLRWRKTLRTTGALPTDEDVRRTRKSAMTQAHLIPAVALLATFLARGFGK